MISGVSVRRLLGDGDKWVVRMERQVGLARIESETHVFNTEEEARLAADRYRAASSGGGNDDEVRLKEARAIVDAPEEFKPICGDGQLFLAYQVLREAGITDPTGISILEYAPSRSH